MRSFLGVPIVTRGEVLGAVYLTEKEDGSMFSAADQKLIELLAAHAAIAIENARLYQRSRELWIIEERNRLARELHDSVTQRLFGVALAAESASTLLERDPSKAAVELAARVRARARRDGGAARGRLRAAAGLAGGRGAGDRAAQARRGAAAGVRRADRAARVRRAAARARARRRRCCGSRRRRSATRCATRRPSGSRVKLGGDGERLFLTVADDGCGFDPAGPEVRGQRLGLTSMEERATELGGTLTVTSTLGEGTTVRAGGARVIRVLLADDHAVVRQGLRTFLDLQDDIEVVAEAGDGEAAVDAAARTDPDVILLDLVMPQLDGVGALKRLRETRARIIVLTSFGDDDKLFAALRAGAAGYLLKDVEPAELVRAIRSAVDGNAPLSPTIATRVVEEIAHGGGAPAEVDDLTPRERDVLILIARGRSNKVIALELGVAEKTVKTHVSHILGKLGLTDRTQAALYAVRHGLV